MRRKSVAVHPAPLALNVHLVQGATDLYIELGATYKAAIEDGYIIGAILREKLFPFVIPERGLVKIRLSDFEDELVSDSDPVRRYYHKIYTGDNIHIAEYNSS